MRRGRDLAMPEAGSIGLLPMSMGRERDKACSGMRMQRLTMFASEGQRAVSLLASSSVIKKISLSL